MSGEESEVVGKTQTFGDSSVHDMFHQQEGLGFQRPHTHTPCPATSQLESLHRQAMAARKNPTMGNMTKAELVHALQELGEEPPASWTKVELKSRLMDLETEMGIKRGGQKGPTPLQVWVTKLNMVNKKRGTLRTFLVEELGGTAPDSATKDQLNKIALDYIYDRAEVCGSDPVGVGQHAAKTYQEVKIMEPEYCIWVKTTAQDSGSIRLLRLAKWLESPAAPPTLRRRERGSGSGSQEPETRVAMQQILVAVRNLQTEVESMKEERPRKKATDGVESSGSFSQVTGSNMADEEDTL